MRDAKPKHCWIRHIKQTSYPNSDQNLWQENAAIIVSNISEHKIWKLNDNYKRNKFKIYTGLELGHCSKWVMKLPKNVN